MTEFFFLVNVSIYFDESLVFFLFFFSSPEPKAPGELIV